MPFERKGGVMQGTPVQDQGLRAACITINIKTAWMLQWVTCSHPSTANFGWLRIDAQPTRVRVYSMRTVDLGHATWWQVVAEPYPAQQAAGRVGIIPTLAVAQPPTNPDACRTAPPIGSPHPIQTIALKPLLEGI